MTVHCLSVAPLVVGHGNTHVPFTVSLNCESAHSICVVAFVPSIVINYLHDNRLCLEGITFYTRQSREPWRGSGLTTAVLQQLTWQCKKRHLHCRWERERERERERDVQRGKIQEGQDEEVSGWGEREQTAGRSPNNCIPYLQGMSTGRVTSIASQVA